MARLNNIKIKFDSFITDSRVGHCFAKNCKFNMGSDCDCGLKKINIGKDGRCEHFELNDKEAER